MPDQPFIVLTDAIDENGFIDPRYACDMDNSSPEMRWDHVPENCAGFAMIMEDPDAPVGLFTHWLIYNIPKEVRHLPAGIPPQDNLPNGIKQGINSYGKLGYAGPCPPQGDNPHRYFFQLFALSKMPDLSPRLRREPLLEAIEPWVIAKAQIMGRYQRIFVKAG